jgi:hypothetical protein
MVARSVIVLGLAALLVPVGQVRSEENKLPDKAKAILDKADQIEFYSLDPGNGEEKKEKPKSTFHDYAVLGKTTIKDAKGREKVLSALQTGIKRGSGAARCFEPRHGIRATHEGKMVDLVICFQCMQVEVYYAKGGERAGSVFTSRSPQETFDKILKDAGVKLAPKAKE